MTQLIWSMKMNAESVIVYRSQAEKAADEYIQENPIIFLTFVGVIAAILIAFFVIKRKN